MASSMRCSCGRWYQVLDLLIFVWFALWRLSIDPTARTVMLMGQVAVTIDKGADSKQNEL
jgi:hypothetical protein